jgi:hypothetical protein
MPVSYICTMDPDVLEDKPGTCPICKMTLQPVRIETAYACPTHPNVRSYDKPGKCPLDKRDLVPMIVNHFWDCGEKPEKFYPDPGRCSDGRPREEKRVVRAHGDHNPRHGGFFYMAEDKWHHLEGTFPQGGPFRVYLYDNFTKDLEPVDVRAITGRAVVLDEALREVASQPLRPSKDGKTLEAPIKSGGFPLRVSARVKFKEATREQPFDFTFAEFSKEPVAAPAPTTTGAAKPAAAPTAAAAAPKPPAAPAPAPATPPAAAPAASAAAQLPTPPAPPEQPPPATPPPGAGAAMFGAPGVPAIAQDMPNTTAELLKLLDQRAEELQSFIKDGNFGMIYIPSIQAKEVALALQDHVSELPARQHVPLTSGVRRLVLAAWRLDHYGDLGDREKITQAHANFAAAAADIKAAYASR